MSDDHDNPIAQILSHFAKKLGDAPGAARLSRLAKSSRHLPGPLLADVTDMVLQLDDPQLVGADLFLCLLDIGYCDLRFADAIAFTTALKGRLQRYLDNPIAANVARKDFKKRTAWWSMALNRSAELCRWPALILLKTCSN